MAHFRLKRLAAIFGMAHLLVQLAVLLRFVLKAVVVAQ